MYTELGLLIRQGFEPKSHVSSLFGVLLVIKQHRFICNTTKTTTNNARKPLFFMCYGFQTCFGCVPVLLLFKTVCPVSILICKWNIVAAAYHVSKYWFSFLCHLCELWRSYRLCDLLVKQMELDDAMNWLSTLGGAYSALGDYFVHHVCILNSLVFSHSTHFIDFEFEVWITLYAAEIFFIDHEMWVSGSCSWSEYFFEYYHNSSTVIYVTYIHTYV